MTLSPGFAGRESELPGEVVALVFLGEAIEVKIALNSIAVRVKVHPSLPRAHGLRTGLLALVLHRQVDCATAVYQDFWAFQEPDRRADKRASFMYNPSISAVLFMVIVRDQM